ncbi:UDP-2,3-diacylglucosamine diphosphatase [Jeongeupia naejangsanensis]|uniref:UDP-2,3-diacylglucosamine hydrolase n=1 Tax=Jeongeupia naejangsanensis TaxID=613195 RepID=A0ABS2BM51_9NEIS|nr:UDP-2,3-diacylglucosamine diphosphatase [Jeongeupia naejangsanensis]MBM3116697.1 UDP-2,3-diacylglucosamine diphosphatase [Jeongeupia naejangsanensis]
MPDPVLLISDLHLSPADPATVDAFGRFLAGPARHAQALYILGDLFEVWIGDDQLGEPFYAARATELRALSASGIPVHFMAGNRDFLCGTRFARDAGLALIADPTTVSPFGAPLLLAHGDAYCTDDVDYQRFRRIVRNPLVQWLWRRLPYRWRNREAAKLREKSTAMNRRKAEAIMDVNPAAIDTAMRKAGVATLIHGHTHRPARHAETAGTRWVLPDWHNGDGGYLRIAEDGIAMLTLDDRPFPGTVA